MRRMLRINSAFSHIKTVQERITVQIRVDKCGGAGTLSGVGVSRLP